MKPRPVRCHAHPRPRARARSSVMAVTLCLASTHLPAQREVPVPEFDSDSIQASYVLAVPPGHDPKQKTPLILDFHGACPPSSKGGNRTYRGAWSSFVKQVSVLVAGPNSRTRAWNMTDGEKNDTNYALHVLDLVGKDHKLDKQQVYLAGFSSGSDFLCKGGLQLKGRFAGCLVVCGGPPSVMGVRKREVAKAKDTPFYFVTGEEDYIRKDGSWQAFMMLERAGGKAMYREVPGLAHKFPKTEEYVRAFRLLQQMAGHGDKPNLAKQAWAAYERQDYLLASTLWKKLPGVAGRNLWADIEKKGLELLAEAEKIDFQKDTGLAYETWWKLRTQFYRFPKLTKRAAEALKKRGGLTNRYVMHARSNLFRVRHGKAPRKFKPLPTGRPRSRPIRKQDPKPTRTGRRTGRNLVYEPKKSKTAVGPWAFDKYLSYDEVVDRLRLLAKQHPGRVKLMSMGKSIEGRQIWVAEITNLSKGAAHKKPAAYIQGGIHGNEISAVMNTLYFAWQMGANPDRRRSIDRLLRDCTLYVAPAVSPDSVQHFVTEPHSMWRPRFNYRPHDHDKDGKVDEDPYEDLNGDGQISQMYVKDKAGQFILRDGRVLRPRRGNAEDAKKPRYRLIGREGIDNDGDGKFSEDPPGGVNLNRNFPVGFRPRKDFKGFRGNGPASEPETRAIIKFVKEHPNISLFLDYHNAAKCVFFWAGEANNTQDLKDMALMAQMAGRARKMMGYVPRPLAHSGVGLSIAWAYGELGLLAGIVELEATRLPEAEYFQKVWKGDVFVEAKPFQHPQLGEILLGNDYKKLPKRSPHPSDIYWQCQNNWDWIRNELKLLPKLTVDNPQIVRSADGFVITGVARNKGKLPMVTNRQRKLGIAGRIQVTVTGAKHDRVTLDPLPPGGEAPFRIEITEPQDTVTLSVWHPKGGAFELPVLRPRIATIPVREKYTIEEGYSTVDDAQRADNAHYKNGVSKNEKGPVFKVKKRDQEHIRVAVLLGEFIDLKRTVPAEDFHHAFFTRGGFNNRSFTGQNVYGSVRDFYREMSYGQMEVEGKVFDWVTLPGKYNDYKRASFGSSKFRDALEAAVLERHGADALDTFDGIIYLWAGNPVARVSCLWPMRLKLKHRPGVISFKAGEFYKGQMAPIGVACHEMGHTFGVNDKYGLGAPNMPMGSWCLMCKGTHGAGNSAQRRPFHQCAWCKMCIGWVKPVVIDPKVPQKLALRPILFGENECYRILLKPDGSEYLLLENRRREGFMTELPSPGLAILKVGPNTRPSAPQKQVQLMSAHGLPPASRTGDLQKMEQVSWPQKGKTEFAVDGVKISNIRLVDDVIYFEVRRQ